MKLGIVGLPNVGKSTLFNAITNAGAESANYAFCTIEPNIGVVDVPDSRLGVLKKLYNSKREVPATIEFVDIAGLVKGASKGEGLGNQFLGNIRQVDAIVHVVRCFESDEIVHVDGEIGPLRDIEVINYELILSDIELIDRRIAKTQKQLKGDKTLAKELEILTRLQAFLSEGKSARAMEVTEEEKEFIDSLFLLSSKPIIYAANFSEDDFLSGIDNNLHLEEVSQLAAQEGAKVLPVCAKIEEEISDMEKEDKEMFLSELGLTESGLDRLIIQCYDLLGLISYLTAGEQEIRAWTIEKGTKAPQAAGKIHSDFERGFIRAEVVPYDELVELGTLAAAREKGVVRSEGKEYIVKDGDVILFRFNV